MTFINQILENTLRFNKEPSSVQQVAMDAIEDVLNGLEIVDPTSPFMSLVEISSANTSASIVQGESLARQLYPKLAINQEELYHHMSDNDFIGRFAQPAKTELCFLLPKDLVIGNAVSNTSNNVQTMVIPRDTVFSVNGINYGIHYPIRISVLPHGAIQVLYDTDTPSDLQTLETNIVDRSTTLLQGTEYLKLNIPVQQFTSFTQTFPLEGSSSFKTAIPFMDSFYFLKAYIDRGNNQWEPILTTHSSQVHDITQTTLLLEVFQNQVLVRLPDIYINEGLAGSSLRVDIFSTLGDYTTDLSEVLQGQFSYETRNFDSFAPLNEVSAFQRITDTILFSTNLVGNGRNALSFEELRQQVVYGAGSSEAPILPGQVEVTLGLAGYNVERFIDNVTDRLYVASRALPVRERTNLLAPVRASNSLVTINENDPTYSESIKSHPTQLRATLVPKALYHRRNELIELLTDNELTALLAQDPTSLVIQLNRGEYFYSPFFYVIDYGQELLRARAYQLDQPSIIGREFIDDNETIDYSISTLSTDISLNDNGFTLTVVAEIPTGLTDEIHLQLRYEDPISDNRGYIDVISSERTSNTVTFTLSLNSTFDIDDQNRILIAGFESNFGAPELYVPLTHTFDLYYLVEGVGSSAPNGFSSNYVVVNNDVIGATYETMTVSLGEYLKHLYVPNRTILSDPTFATYPADVPATYTETVYRNGTFGNDFVVNNDGTVTLQIDHQAGDVIPGEFTHRQGDIVLTDGEPTVIDPGVLNRTLGVTLVSALYRFATTEDIVTYRDNITRVITGYLDNDIEPASGRLQERTRLEYQPRGAVSQVRVNTGGDVFSVIDSTLSFRVTYYLTPAGRTDNELQLQLAFNVRRVVSEEIQSTMISAPLLENRLREEGGSEVIDVDVERFGPNKDIAVMSLDDPSTSFGIQESLVLLANGDIDIEDSIDINFVEFRQ